MSFNSSPNLVLELRRPWLRVLPAIVLLLTALTLPWFAGAAPFWPRILCAVLPLSLAIWSIRSGMGRISNNPVIISWGQEQQWRMRFGRGETSSVVLSGRSWLSPWLMCLKFTTETGAWHQVMCWRGELSTAVWQQWQLRLRLEAGQRTEQPASGIAP